MNSPIYLDIKIQFIKTTKRLRTTMGHYRSTPSAPPTAGSRLLPLALLLLVGSLLGVSLVIAKLADDPLTLLVMSMLGAGIVLLGGEYVKKSSTPVNARVAEYGLVAGLLFALPNAIGFLAVEHVGAGFISLTFAFPILLTYLIALGLKMDHFTGKKALGVALGLSGGAVLALSKVSDAASPHFWVGVSLLSPIVISLGNIYRTKRWPSGASPTYLAAVMLICGGLLLFPVCIAWAPDGFTKLLSASTQLVLLLIQIGVISV
jgi:drug/metabolite transporter (DMT)-like permease